MVNSVSVHQIICDHSQKAQMLYCNCLRNDIAVACGVWESLLKISGLTLEAWNGYIAMEIENDNINEARPIYRRCYTEKFPGLGSEEICQLWLRFEREFGTLEDYDQAFEKAARETGALKEAKDKLEKRVEELTWRIQLEKRLKAALQAETVSKEEVTHAHAVSRMMNCRKI